MFIIQNNDFLYFVEFSIWNFIFYRVPYLALAKTFEAIEAVSARYERLILDPDQNRHNREHLKVLL